jgi:hypothetical protein
VAQERHRSAVLNLNQARSDAQEYGEIRRNELRRLARDIRDGRRDEARDEMAKDEADGGETDTR